MLKSVYLSFQSLMVPYLLESKYLLDHYINLYRNFFDKIKSSHTYYDLMQPTLKQGIIEIIFYYKIVKKKLLDKNETYNNKRCVVLYGNFFVDFQDLEVLEPNTISNHRIKKITYNEEEYKRLN